MSITFIQEDMDGEELYILVMAITASFLYLELSPTAVSMGVIMSLMDLPEVHLAHIIGPRSLIHQKMPIVDK